MPQSNNSVTLEASVSGLSDPKHKITFTRRTDRNDVFIVIEPAEVGIAVSAIALRSATEVILDGPDAPNKN